jgi:hypothetical protein
LFFRLFPIAARLALRRPSSIAAVPLFPFDSATAETF